MSLVRSAIRVFRSDEKSGIEASSSSFPVPSIKRCPIVHSAVLRESPNCLMFSTAVEADCEFYSMK